MYLFFQSLFSDIRGLPRPVFIIVIGQFLNRFGCFVYPFLTLYLAAANYSALKITTIIGAMGIGNIVGPIISGYLADAIGRKRTMVLSLFGSAATMLTIFFATEHYFLLLIACFAHGLINFLFGPAASALLTDIVPSEKRVTAYAMIRLALNGGFAAGPAIGGLLYAYAPWLVFVGDALTTLLFGILAALYLPHGLKTIEGRIASPTVFLNSWKEALADLGRHPLFKQYLMALIFMAFGFCQVFSVLALSATDQGLTTGQYGLIMSLNGLLILFVELPISHWLKRFAPQLVLAIGFSLIGLGLGVFAFASSFLSFTVAMTVFTAGEIIALPIGMAYSSDLAPEKFRGRYLGLRGIAWGLAGCLSSSGLWIYSQIGSAVWLIAGASSLIAALIFCAPIKLKHPNAVKVEV